MYDYLIVTHIPAFYKINLYNELAKRLKIFVIFISSDTSQKRSNNFSSVNDALFYYEVLYQGDFQKRKIFKNILAIQTILSRVKFGIALKISTRNFKFLISTILPIYKNLPLNFF